MRRVRCGPPCPLAGARIAWSGATDEPPDGSGRRRRARARPRARCPACSRSSGSRWRACCCSRSRCGSTGSPTRASPTTRATASRSRSALHGHVRAVPLGGQRHDLLGHPVAARAHVGLARRAAHALGARGRRGGRRDLLGRPRARDAADRAVRRAPAGGQPDGRPLLGVRAAVQLRRALQRALDGAARAPPPHGRPLWLAGYALGLALAAYSNTLAPFLLVPVHAVLVVPAGRAAVRRLAVASPAPRCSRRPSPCSRSSSPAGAIRSTGCRARASAARRVAEEFMIGRASNELATVRVAAVLGLLATACSSPRTCAGAADPARRAPLVAWTFLPLAVALAISIEHPVFFGAYLIVALPGLCLLVASGAARCPPVARRWCSARSCWRGARGAGDGASAARLDYRAAAAWISAARPSSDPVISIRSRSSRPTATTTPPCGHPTATWSSRSGTTSRCPPA